MLSTTTLLILTVTALIGEQRVHAYAPTGQQYQNCGLERHLGVNESFIVHHFPGEYGMRWTPSSGYWHIENVPRECTWNFKAAGDCTLTFRAAYYERGDDIRCDEQYLLLGDENSEERFCGFRRPPSRFNSTGRNLFLTHFQRNGNGRRYGQTLRSHIGGTVRCKKFPPPSPCVPPVSECALLIKALPCIPKTLPLCTVELQNGSSTLEIVTCERPNTCEIKFRFCQSSVPANQTCETSPFELAPIDGTVNCTTHNIQCPAEAPNCNATLVPTYLFRGTELSHEGAGGPCGSPGTLCTRQTQFCFT